MNSTTTDDDGVASRPRDSTGAPGREDACVRSLARALDDLASGAFCRRAVQSAGRPIGAMMMGMAPGGGKRSPCVWVNSETRAFITRREPRGNEGVHVES